MKHRRSFAADLKRQIVEELLSGMSTPAQLTRRYEISSGLLYHWKEQYAKGRYDNEPSKEAALEDRVHQLEQLVGKLTLENEFLKKAVQRGLLTLPKKSDNLLLNTVTSSKARKGGANSCTCPAAHIIINQRTLPGMILNSSPRSKQLSKSFPVMDTAASLTNFTAGVFR
jgi:transposase